MSKVYIKTFGCSANKSDSEVMAGLLAQAGHKIIKTIKDADLVLINSCGVKGRAEVDFFREIDSAKKLKKKIIAAGCIPSGNKEIVETKLKGISIVDINSIHKIALAAEKTLAGERIILLSNNKIEKICLPRQRLNKVIAIVPICEGCAGSCAYCFTKLAKGNLFSYSESAILNEVESAIKEGCREIWLTSQDCAAYGLDIGNTNLAKLLEKICKIPGDFYVRVGMGNPNHILKILPELIEAYKNPKVFKFLHMPVQSGNNRILKGMNRYTAEQFRAIVKEFRKQITDLTISTDIICGFPTETDGEFQDSVDLAKWLQPDAINVSMFWPRPGTIAEKMKQLPGEIKKKRSREMTKQYHSIALRANKTWIGKKCGVLIDEIGKKGGFVARNASYKPIVLKKNNLKLGNSHRVRIINATKNYLVANF